jgi:hypothetical protein
MAEQDEGASEMEHAREVLEVILVARDQPTIILEPCKQPFNLPSVTIATQGAAIVCQVRTVAMVRCDHLYIGFSQFSIKLVRVVGIVTNQALDRFFHKDLCELFGSPASLHVAWRFLCKP